MQVGTATSSTIATHSGNPDKNNVTRRILRHGFLPNRLYTLAWRQRYIGSPFTFFCKRSSRFLPPSVLGSSSSTFFQAASARFESPLASA